MQKSHPFFWFAFFPLGWLCNPAYTVTFDFEYDKEKEFNKYKDLLVQFPSLLKDTRLTMHGGMTMVFFSAGFKGLYVIILFAWRKSNFKGIY